MKDQKIEDLLTQVERRFEQEGNLIELDSGIAVFVGDTHGDLEATTLVIERHLTPEKKLVFLGDYVDRGPDSEENLNLLLWLKLKHPDNVYLLMGNHEGRSAVRFYPSDFWEGLSDEVTARYASVLSKLPLAVSTSNGIIALHGALPSVECVEEICGITYGGPKWRQITWGDWEEDEGEFLGIDDQTGRPQFGRGWFDKIMGRLGKNVLIRSHQPGIKRTMYGGRCVTIFTSSAHWAYVSERTIAIADLDKPVNTADDLVIETV